MYKQLKNKSGFTLVELLVVMAIMLIIMSTISSFLIANIRAFNLSERQLTAQTQAQYAITRFVDRCIGTKGISAISFNENGDMHVDFVKPGSSELIRFDFEDNTLSVTEGGLTQKLADSIEAFEILPIPTVIENPKEPDNYISNSCIGLQITVVSNVKGTKITLTNEVYFRNK